MAIPGLGRDCRGSRTERRKDPADVIDTWDLSQFQQFPVIRLRIGPREALRPLNPSFLDVRRLSCYKRPFWSVTSRCQQAPRLRSLHPEEECRYKYGVTCARKCGRRGANNAASAADSVEAGMSRRTSWRSGLYRDFIERGPGAGADRAGNAGRRSESKVARSIFREFFRNKWAQAFVIWHFVLRVRAGVWPGDLHEAEKPAGASRDARDFRIDLRDLQNLPDHAGEIAAAAGSVRS